MGQARVTRYCAYAEGGSSSIDMVVIETEEGSSEMAYSNFENLFGIRVGSGKCLSIEVDAKAIPDSDCTVAR
jgi:hypothetical protein